MNDGLVVQQVGNGPSAMSSSEYIELQSLLGHQSPVHIVALSRFIERN